jgi:hypothetical protein
MGALTGRAAFPSHGLRSRNRLAAIVGGRSSEAVNFVRRDRWLRYGPS